MARLVGRVKQEGFHVSHLQNFHTQLLGNPQGPKLVFLHGLMGSGANWRKITPAFEREFQILLLDQRGHGRSFHPPQGYAPEDYAQDLALILDELGWGDQAIHLVGHSMGGRNALVFANRFPRRVNKLVIEDIGPDANLESARRIEGYLDMIPTPFPDKRAAKHFFAETFPQLVGGGAQARVLAEYFYANLRSGAEGKADWRFSPVGVRASVREGRARERWELLATLAVPTLVIRGSQSTDLSREVFDRMLQANPKIRGAQIEGAGHWVHFDQPQAFIALLQAFFKEP